MPTQGRPPWPASKPPPMLDVSPCCKVSHNQSDLIGCYLCHNLSDDIEMLMKNSHRPLSLFLWPRLPSPCLLPKKSLSQLLQFFPRKWYLSSASHCSFSSSLLARNHREEEEEEENQRKLSWFICYMSPPSPVTSIVIIYLHFLFAKNLECVLLLKIRCVWKSISL